MKKLLKSKKWKVVATLIAFMLTNYWSYENGSKSGEALLIDTMSRYRSFYEEVRANPKIACGKDGKLRGLYLSQYNSMLPVIEGEVTPPYDNPCPNPGPPAPPKTLKLNICKSWDTWDDFLADPNPSMGINIFDSGSIMYPLDEEWRNSIIKWHDEGEKARQEALKKCPEGKSCETEIKVEFGSEGKTCETEIKVKVVPDGK